MEPDYHILIQCNLYEYGYDYDIIEDNINLVTTINIDLNFTNASESNKKEETIDDNYIKKLLIKIQAFKNI